MSTPRKKSKRTPASTGNEKYVVMTASEIADAIEAQVAREQAAGNAIADAIEAQVAREQAESNAIAYKHRLERAACAIASGWYAVTPPPMQGLQDFGENPRADLPVLVATAIVEHARALLAEVDDAVEEYRANGGKPPSSPPPGPPAADRSPPRPAGPTVAETLATGQQTAASAIVRG